MIRGPLGVVVTLLLNVKALPVRLMPLRPVVVKAPKLVVPVPASCEMVAAEIVLEVTFPALVI